MISWPISQGELIRSARGARTQVEFAHLLGCDRSCLSRYEGESLGAPTGVINFCLKAVAADIPIKGGTSMPIDTALRHAREAVAALESLQFPLTDKPSTKRSAR